MCMTKSISEEKIVLPKYMNKATHFSDLLFKVKKSL